MGVQREVSVANRVYEMSYQTLLNFSENVVAQMTAAIATFATPTPALATITTANTNLQARITAWGNEGNRGSHADLIALRSARDEVRNLLEQEAGYVQGVARSLAPLAVDQKDIILSAGMRPKDDSQILPAPNPPQNARQLVKQNLLGTLQIALKWAKPLTLPGSNSKPPFYYLQSSDDNVVWNTIATVTKTSALVQMPTNATVYFRVIAVNATGQSGPSVTIVGIPQ